MKPTAAAAAALAAAARWLLADADKKTGGGDDVAELPGLEVVADHAPVERETSIGTYDALGVKAGIVAAAAPALVALAADGWAPLVIVGGISSLVALFKALRVAMPRDIPGLDLRRVRRKYGKATRAYATRRILGDEIAIVNKINEHTESMFTDLRSAMLWLRITAVALVIAVLVAPVYDIFVWTKERICG